MFGDNDARAPMAPIRQYQGKDGGICNPNRFFEEHNGRGPPARTTTGHSLSQSRCKLPTSSLNGLGLPKFICSESCQGVGPPRYGTPEDRRHLARPGRLAPCDIHKRHFY